MPLFFVSIGSDLLVLLLTHDAREDPTFFSSVSSDVYVVITKERSAVKVILGNDVTCIITSFLF